MSLTRKPEFVFTERELEVTISCDFSAPPSLVFRAHTEPELLMNWWGPATLTMTIESYDVRPGGKWRIVHVDPAGNEHGFRGEFHEIRKDSLLRYTFEYEGAPGHIVQKNVTFEAIDGGTRVVDHSKFDSLEAMQGMVNSGMEPGMRESLARLTELLGELTPAQK